MVKNDLGKIVRERRKALNLTQEQLAAQLSLSTKYISDIENGRRFPSIDTLILISEKLEFPISAVFDDDEPLAEEERNRMERILRSNSPENRAFILEMLELVTKNLVKREISLHKYQRRRLKVTLRRKKRI